MAFISKINLANLKRLWPAADQASRARTSGSACASCPCELRVLCWWVLGVASALTAPVTTAARAAHGVCASLATGTRRGCLPRHGGWCSVVPAQAATSPATSLLRLARRPLGVLRSPFAEGVSPSTAREAGKSHSAAWGRTVPWCAVRGVLAGDRSSAARPRQAPAARGVSTSAAVTAKSHPFDPSEAPHHYVWSSKMSVARVYADVNSKRPEEYWDYESLQVQWGCVGVAVLALHTRRVCTGAVVWVVASRARVIAMHAWCTVLVWGASYPCVGAPMALCFGPVAMRTAVGTTCLLTGLRLCMCRPVSPRQ